MIALGEARSSCERRFDKLDREILGVRTEQVLLQRMAGFVLALHVAIFICVFLR